MALGKRLINTGAAAAACLTEDVNPFTGTSADGGVALYSLDYDGSEASGNYPTTIYDGNGDFGVGGITNTGIRFSKNTTGLTNTNLFLDSTAHSVSLWVNRKSLSTGRWQIIYFSNSTGKPAFTLGRRSDRTQFHYRNESSSEVYFDLSSANVWYHIVVARDNNGSEIFVNGVSVATDSSSMGTTSSSSYNKTAIGSNPNYTSEYFDGTIDQVRVFSKKLSSDDISALYNSGNGETACVYTATTTDNNYPTTNLAYYKLDNSAEDEKGSYDGTETNIEYRFGRFGQAAVFNGSSSILLPNSLDSALGNNNFSYSFWINGPMSSTDQIWLSLAQNYFIYIGYFSNQIYISLYNDVFSTSVTISANTWTHIALVKSSSDGIEIYKDGVSAYTSTTAAAKANLGTAGNGQVNVIGRYSGSGYDFEGSIDQVRIFSTELSSSQVTQLYNEKPEVDTSNFKTVLYDGNGSTQFISNVGIDLETSGGLVWIKKRSGGNTRDNMLYDSVRGAGNRLKANKDLAQSFATDELTSFEANGFFTGSSDSTNGSSSSPNYVSWVFKGGGDAVQNNEGTITSSVSANTAAGFSIAKYTGVGYPQSTTAEVGHGLDSTPDIVIIKAIGGSGFGGGVAHWVVGTSHVPSDPWIGGMYLSTNGEYYSSINYFWNGTPTSDVVKIKTDPYVNSTNVEYVMYSWHSVAGYSKIGSYTGNGSTDGPTVNIGFEPAWLMIKKTNGTGQWLLVDNARNPSNPVNARLRADKSDAESTSYNILNFLSNGFKIITADNDQNTDEETYLYMAFK